MHVVYFAINEINATSFKYFLEKKNRVALIIYYYYYYLFINFFLVIASKQGSEKAR